jgi:uridine kinase/cytidine deaminase
VKGTKRGLAVLLASLQFALSFGFPGYAAAADVVIQQVQTAVPVQFGPAGTLGQMKLGGPASLTSGSLVPTSALSGPNAAHYVPQVQDRSFSAPVIGLPISAIPQAADLSQTAPAAVQHSPVSLTLSKPQLAAPAAENAPSADGQAGPMDIQKTSARIKTSLELPGLSRKAPAESSRDAAEQVFAELRNEKLASTTQGAVSAQTAGTFSTSQTLPKTQTTPLAAKTLEVPAAQTSPSAKSFWQSPTVKWITGGLAVAGIAAAAPVLAAHVGLVAAAGSITLSLLGVPQIFKNFKAGREGTKDVVLAGPLMWFAAASLLALVGIGNGSSIWWNAANVAGVVESATVVGQLNYYKKDSKSLKATIATVAGVALPIALIASQVLMPLSTGLSVAFTGAMLLLGALDAPQIRQNNNIFKNEGRAPQGISPWFKGLLVAGSLMHLFAALMGGDMRWALNAAIAVTMGSTVLAQMYLPRAANAVLGPIVKGAEKLLALLHRGAKPAVADPAAAGVAEARALIDKEFAGADYMRYQGQDPAQALASIQEKAQALPGRSAILLEAPTAAGKSTLAEVMHKTLSGRIVVFPVDRYFKSYGDIPADPLGRPDYDRPEAIYLQRAAQDVKTLLAGGRIELPKHVMDGPTTFDSGEFLQLGPDDVVIVDSIFASHRYFLEAVKGHQALNVYLAAPAAIRLARRLKRDKTERGISVENNLKGWSHLLVNERNNILPLREQADVVVNLMSAAELARLPQAYAELLAAEWAANNHDAAATELFLKMLRASIAADRTPGPLPTGDPEKLMRQVDVTGDAPAPERLKVLVAKALETYTAVQKEAAEQPNFSNFHVHAAVELSNATWASAPNVELSREVTLCAERTAILAALANAPAGTTVKTIVVSNSGGEFKNLCAECLSWLATGKFFSPDTEIVSVARDPATGRISIRIRTLKSILPYHLGAARQPSITDQPIGSLEVAVSPAAAELGASASAAKSLMEQARKAYARGAADKFAAKPSAAAVRLSDSGTAGAVRFQWAARFSDYEDLGAAASALEKSAKRRARLQSIVRLADKATFGLLKLQQRAAGLLAAPSIAAVAYYGADADLPPIASIGRLTRQGAGPNTLILRIEDGRVQVRTLGEYMTEIYDRH